MGTGFTIDTPLKVARFGISSVISLVDDVLIEQMRKYHSEHNSEAYFPILDQEEDRRARRITAYLNLLDRLIKRQVQKLQNAPFHPDSEITRYYEMLPEGPRKTLYCRMMSSRYPAEKARLEAQLRQWATPGTIDVNIMTKLDRDSYKAGAKLSAEHSDAMSALRGFAESNLESSLVFSAGLNARLYSYAAQFTDFLPNATGKLKKKIILKVSDYRSAAIQGKFLAKRGLWISEFRIESGLNCGGHAFATEGLLMGPILEEFYLNRQMLSEELYHHCNAALESRGKQPFMKQPDVRVTVQGGLGTAEEQNLLQSRYHVDGTGWGSPFLLVPEATNVDANHLQKLVNAKEGDVQLSDHSPLGVPFWVLVNSESEKARQNRIADGHPGSDCPKRYLALNSEFTTVPICPASHAYQRLKLKSIMNTEVSDQEKVQTIERALDKSCICHDLAGGAVLKNGIDPLATTAICPGPNIIHFKRIASLREMIDHIYGRTSLIGPSPRSHIFVNELRLYVEYLRKECRQNASLKSSRIAESLKMFRDNLLLGIEHYKHAADALLHGKEHFLQELDALTLEVNAIPV